jgi:1-acyl-sn-glycerol-3-phosphate acyltransferase
VALLPGPIGGAVRTLTGAAGAALDMALPPRGDQLAERDPETIRRTLPAMSALWHTYFRADVRGLERIPAEGPVLLVGNHSGGIYIADTFVFATAFYRHFGAERRFHQLAHDLVLTLPGLGLLRRYGTVAASHEHARRALRSGAAVLVYPGGDHETFRPSWHGSDIEFGGRRGFVRLALEEGVPVVPVVSIGGQETALFLTRGRRAVGLLGLDRLLRLKVLPVAIGPPLGVTVLDFPGRIPLPAKITIQVLPPIDLRERVGRDADAAYDLLVDTMQDALDELDDERSLPIVG